MLSSDITTVESLNGDGRLLLFEIFIEITLIPVIELGPKYFKGLSHFSLLSLELIDGLLGNLSVLILS